MAVMKKTIEIEVEICDFCGVEITKENTVYDVLRDDKIICEHCAHNDYFCCPDCGDYFPLGESVEHSSLGDYGESYCPKCATKVAHEILEIVKEIRGEA